MLFSLKINMTLFKSCLWNHLGTLIYSCYLCGLSNIEFLIGKIKNPIRKYFLMLILMSLESPIWIVFSCLSNKILSSYSFVQFFFTWAHCYCPFFKCSMPCFFSKSFLIAPLRASTMHLM